MVLVQQQISQKQLQILRRLMDSVFQVIVIGPDEGIAEVPGILRENVVGHIKAESPQIQWFLLSKLSSKQEGMLL